MASNKKRAACLRGQRTKLAQVIKAELTTADELLVRDNFDERVSEDYVEMEAQVELLNALENKFDSLTIQIVDAIDDDDAEAQSNQDGASAMETSIAIRRKISRLKGRLCKLKAGSSCWNSAKETNSNENATVQQQIDAALERERLRYAGGSERRSNVFIRSSQIRLPKIEFSSFNGDLLRWQEFWDAFEAAVDRKEDLQPVEKLSYLRSKLDGDAIATIEGLQTTNDNYGVAISLLKSRCGNTQVLITTHYTEMMDLPRSPNVTSKIRELHDQLEKHLRALEALGEDISHRHFISLIMAKLPWQVIAN